MLSSSEQRGKGGRGWEFSILGPGQAVRSGEQVPDRRVAAAFVTHAHVSAHMIDLNYHSVCFLSAGH